MISKRSCGESAELLITYPLPARVFGLVLAGSSGILLFFYFQSSPAEPVKITLGLLFFCSLILVGLSLFRARLVVNQRTVEEQGLFRRRRVPLPERTTVEVLGGSVALHGSSNEVLYQCDRSFNHGKQLEFEMRKLFNSESEALR